MQRIRKLFLAVLNWRKNRNKSIVKKTDWQTIDMPEITEEFEMDYKLSMGDIEILCQGYLPKEMEDKWFVYCEADTLYCHRSWTGFCIYIVKISNNHETLCVTVNRNPEQYTETAIEGDKINLAILLNSLLNKPDSELWEQYMKHISNSIKEHKHCH